MARIVRRVAVGVAVAVVMAAFSGFAYWVGRDVVPVIQGWLVSL